MLKTLVEIKEKALEAFKNEYNHEGSFIEVADTQKVYVYENRPAIIVNDGQREILISLEWDKNGKHQFHEEVLENQGVPACRYYVDDTNEVHTEWEPEKVTTVRAFCQQVKTCTNSVVLKVKDGALIKAEAFYNADGSFTGFDIELDVTVPNTDYLWHSLFGKSLEQLIDRFGKSFVLTGEWTENALVENEGEKFLRYNVYVDNALVFDSYCDTRNDEGFYSESFIKSGWLHGSWSRPKFAGYFYGQPCYVIGHYHNSEVLFVYDHDKEVQDDFVVPGYTLTVNSDSTNPVGNAVGKYEVEYGRVHYKTGVEDVDAQTFIGWAKALGERAYIEIYATRDVDVHDEVYYVVKGYDLKNVYPSYDFGWKRVRTVAGQKEVIKALVNSLVDKDHLLNKDFDETVYTVVVNGKGEPITE